MARRKAIHEEIYLSTLSIFSFINCFLGDFSLSNAASKTQVKTVHHQQRQSRVRWTAPQAGWCKVNVDATIFKTRVTGAGTVAAICRDDRDQFLGASARIIEGISDPTTLEAYACYEGLALAADLLVQKVAVYTNW
jgi:hypothetical protein